MNEDRIKELFSNEEFVKDLFASQSFDDAQAKLKAEGIDISPEELREAYSLLQKRQAGELSDEELENVAGGAIGGAIVVAVVFGIWGYGMSVAVRPTIC